MIEASKGNLLGGPSGSTEEPYIVTVTREHHVIHGIDGTESRSLASSTETTWGRIDSNHEVSDKEKEKKGPPPHSIDYRPEIDGLRTLAVIPVLIFHAWPEAFPGGK